MGIINNNSKSSNNYGLGKIIKILLKILTILAIVVRWGLHSDKRVKSLSLCKHGCLRGGLLLATFFCSGRPHF